MDNLFGLGDAVERDPGLSRRSSTGLRRDNRRGLLAVSGDGAKEISLAQEQTAERGLADADCILQHGIEHGLNSPGELEMTFRTSEVAVCCSSASERSSVRWRSSLSSRVFSMAMTAWAAKF